MNKNIFLILIFSLVLVQCTLAAIDNQTLIIPSDKDVILTFTGFQEAKLSLNDSTTIFFNFYEQGELINNSFDIFNITDSQVIGNLIVNGTDKGEFILESGKDQTINLTEKTPFIVTNTFIFNKNDINTAVIKMKLPFISIGQKMPDVTKPSIELINDITLEKHEGLSLKILIIIVIALLLILIFFSYKLRK